MSARELAGVKVRGGRLRGLGGPPAARRCLPGCCCVLRLLPGACLAPATAPSHTHSHPTHRRRHHPPLAQVRHDASELGEGETMILTLADRGILDEAGNLVEEGDVELENVLKVGGVWWCVWGGLSGGWGGGRWGSG